MKPKLLFTLMLAAMVAACERPPYPQGTLDELYPQPPKPDIKTLVVDGVALTYAQMGQGDTASSTPLVFVHGSPGDWKAWARYLDAPQLAGLGPKIAIDRPGFGGSVMAGVMTDLRTQAELFAHWASAVLPAGKSAVVVGHSLGGPIAAWMLLDHPEQFRGAVIVAGSMAPDLEGPRWYNRLADTAFVRRLLPEALTRSNDEMMPLQSELRRLDQAWPQLKRPIIAIQGEDDDLVDPRTVDYLERRVDPALLKVQRVPGFGHFVVWERMDLVFEGIQALAH